MGEEKGFKPEDLAVLVQTAVEKKEKDVHWTVKVFGGALLSVSAVVIIGAFQSAFSGISDCQKTIQQLLTKDEFNLRTKALWDDVKEGRERKAEIAALRERIKLLEQQNRDLTLDLQKLREKISHQ